MPWEVLQHPEFTNERSKLPDDVSDKLREALLTLSIIGPKLGRPLVDTLKGSRHANMKELRFSESKGVWRFAFAFDRNRSAVILVGAEKQGVSQQQFYKTFVRIADKRFDEWLRITE